MPAAPTAVDAVLRALSDPTRRRVMERLGHGPSSMSELAAPFDMALPSFLQHMKVLETSGLVASRKVGRVRTYRLVPRRLEVLAGWLAEQRRIWERRLDQFDEYVTRLHNGSHEPREDES